MEPVVKRRKVEPRKLLHVHKQRVDDERKEQPLMGQSPVSSSTVNQAEPVQQSSCKRVQVIVGIILGV